MTSRFHRLHVPGDPFILPCAWDVASGQLFAEAGHPAIGTTSLGVAAGSGARDEDRDTREAMVGLMRSLRRALPEALLSCDFEDGYADDPQEVVEILRSAFTADDPAGPPGRHGLIVDGINIEDSSGGHLDAPEVLAAKVSAISQTLPDLFINARIDTFWLGRDLIGEVIERIDAYARAGADGIFVPGTHDQARIAAIVEASPLPVNVLAGPALSRSGLAEAGVARISTGSLLHRSALSAAVQSLAVLDDDRPAETAGVLSYRAVADLGGQSSS